MAYRVPDAMDLVNTAGTVAPNRDHWVTQRVPWQPELELALPPSKQARFSERAMG
jgi:hypothetical protein